MDKTSTGIFSNKFRHQFLATLCGNILTFSHGITIGWYVPTLLCLQSDQTPLKSGKINLDEVSWIGSLLCIGGIIGNTLFGILLNKFGRKKTLLLLGIPQICSWLTIIFGSNVYHLYIARLFAGTTGGGLFTTLPIFIAEIADKSIRGTLASMMMLILNCGILIGYIVGSYVPYNIFPYTIVGAPIIYTLFIMYFPETPQYLLEEKKDIEAEVSYKFYCNFTESTTKDSRHFNENFTNLRISVRGDGSKQDEKLTINDFSNPTARKGIIIGFVLMGLSQLSGSFAIVNYMANIFASLEANVDVNTNLIIVGIIQVLGTYVSTLLVDRAGRKVLLVSSSLLTSLGLAGIALYAYFNRILDLSYINWAPVVSLSFAIFSACIGVIPLPFLIMTEVVPLKIRSIVSSICVIILSIQAFGVMKVYPLLLDTLHVSGCTLISSIACVFGAIFVITYVPETKGKSLSK